MHPSTIVAVAARPLDVAMREPFGIAQGAQEVARNVVCTVRLADGTIGLGEAAPFPAVSGETQADALSGVARAIPLLEGQDAGRWRRLARLLGEALADVPSARCGLETAILDALLRQAGLSMWRFFGGCEPMLRSDITIVTGSIAQARAAASSAREQGFDVLKVKIGGADPALDLARLFAIAEAAPAAGLLLDANASLAPEAAARLFTELGALRERVVLFEQPTPRGDSEALYEVHRRTGVPVAADESARSVADVAALARMGAAQVINVKITKSGLAEALDMAACARGLGLGLMIGGMVETPLAMSASACLAAGLGGFRFVDLDTPLFMRDLPTRGGWLYAGPELRVDGDAPGHGVSLHDPAGA